MSSNTGETNRSNLKHKLTREDMGKWFDFEYLESGEIEGNELYRQQTFDGEDSLDGLSVLQHRILIEEFYHFEKIKNDFIVFLSKFFDNTKTNMYKKVIKEYQERVGKNFFSFFFQVTNRYCYLYDFSKMKKNATNFIKINVETSNEEVIQLFVDFIKDNIHSFAQNTRQTTQKLTPAGETHQISAFSSSTRIGLCSRPDRSSSS